MVNLPEPPRPVVADVVTPEIDLRVDSFALQHIAQPSGAGFQFVLPCALPHAENHFPLVVEGNVRMIRRHAVEVDARRVLIEQIIHVVAEEHMRIIKAGQRQPNGMIN